MARKTRQTSASTVHGQSGTSPEEVGEAATGAAPAGAGHRSDEGGWWWRRGAVAAAAERASGRAGEAARMARERARLGPGRAGMSGGGGGDVSRAHWLRVAAQRRPADGGHVRRRRERFLGFRGGRRSEKGGDLFIAIEGARRVQMRCGFRPRDRDRTL